MSTDLPSHDSLPEPASRVPCRRCERPVRPARPCPRCGIETPPPYADRPEIALAIVNNAAAVRRYLRGARS